MNGNDGLIIEAMKKNDVRLSTMNRWAVAGINENGVTYLTVYYRKSYARNPICVYEGYDLEKALRALLEE